MILLQAQSAGFLEQWQNAATTTFGLFWMALWAFILGYVVRSMIQVFVTHRPRTAYRAPVRLLHSDDENDDGRRQAGREVISMMLPFIKSPIVKTLRKQIKNQ